MNDNTSHIKTFKYKDEDGNYHTITCTGHEVVEPKMTPIYATLGDSYEKIRTDLKVHHRQFTGIMSVGDWGHMLDLVSAEKVYFVYGARETLITVLDFDLTQDLPRAEQIEGWFEWIVAKEDQVDVNA